MNKKELIGAMAKETKLTLTDAGKALDAFVNSVQTALKNGEDVSLIGFGSFSVKKKAAREGVNPATGKKIKIAAKKVVKFKAGSALSKLVQ
jgi:DNA-binding protein HU-beta